MEDRRLNVITLFSGYDSQCLALDRLKFNNPQFDYDLVAWAEIDKHACMAHDALFPQFKGRNVGDVSRVDWAEWHSRHPQPIDLLTYSSPCQDFSSAGLQRGGEEGSGTRSGLLWETERAVRELRPRHLVFENVGGLVSDKFIDLFNRWQARLNGYGYTNFQQLMNAKDYGVPQNRLRIFMVSILDCPRAYYFPKPFKLERRLKDVLEQNVEERYYLSDAAVARLTKNISNCGSNRDLAVDKDSVARTLCASMAKITTFDNYVEEPCIAAMRGRDKDNPNDRGKSTDNYTQRLELKPDGTSNTITSVAKDNLLIEPSVMQIGNIVSDSDFDNPQRGRVYDPKGISPCINGMDGGSNKPKVIEPGIRIRRLTERELYRLMDLEEADIDILLNTSISKTSHAKLAGNSIVVSVMYLIFYKLFINPNPDKNEQLQLF